MAVHRKKKTLSVRQELFAHEYLVDMNAKEAAIRAGYSKGRATATGCDLLKHPLIQKVIQIGAKARLKRVGIDADWVLTELVDLYKHCRKGMPVLDSHGNQTGEWRFEAAAANKALENIGKHIDVCAFTKEAAQDAPVDVNWTVRVVHCNQEEFEKGFGKPVIEHQP